MPDAVAEPALQPPAPRPMPPAGKRLAWLDALRGIAALCVVFDHLSYDVLQHARTVVYHWFNPGQYGVFVFFLVSGYIVPASLERKGSVRSFWVSRVFRLYPLYLVAIAGMVVLWVLRIGSLNGMTTDPVSSAGADVFMLQSVLWAPTVPNVVWSLAYEMVFYLMLTALFVTGAHRRSSRYALVFAVAAVALGGLLRPATLSHHLLRAGAVVAITDAAILAGLALAVAGRGLPRIAGAALAALTGLAVVMFNSGFAAPWEGFTIFALMFLGTVLYRAERGEYDWPRAILVAAAVFGILLAAEMWHDSPSGNLAAIRMGFITLALAGATFAVGMAARHRKVPGILAWLGLVSYSVYLLHPLLIEVYARVSGIMKPHPFPVQVALAAGFVLVLLGCSALTYRLIEAPMQRHGRWLARRLDSRFGEDSAERPHAEPAGEPAAGQEYPRPGMLARTANALRLK
jgi:peptidoglycan/LPS O-acetylase OafA/YrhL